MSARDRARSLREAAVAVLVAVLLATYARTFLALPLRVRSASMEPTVLAGERVLVNRFVFAPTRFAWERRWLPQRPPRSGDLVLFRHPLAPRLRYLKRVAPAAGGPGAATAGTRAGLFVMGDNRAVSVDSRAFGRVPRSLVLGRALLVYWSRCPAGERCGEPRVRWRRLFAPPR